METYSATVVHYEDASFDDKACMILDLFEAANVCLDNHQQDLAQSYRDQACQMAFFLGCDNADEIVPFEKGTAIHQYFLNGAFDSYDKTGIFTLAEFSTKGATVQ